VATRPPAIMQTDWAVYWEHEVGCDIHSFGEQRGG
jgi:hypothetical protein